MLGAAGAVALATAGAAQNGTAIYELRFDTTWSAVTHPVEFPPNPHFSPPVGGTHDGATSFWQPGGLATPGIQAMAEGGATSPLSVEISAAVTAGGADQILRFSGLGSSPASRTVTFNVQADFPYVTLVSMLAPSPDWFVGVSGLHLRPNDVWIDDLVVPLTVWDAGTDSGTTYLSPNLPTVPAAPIDPVTTGAGPFQGLPGPVGTFTLRRRASSLVYGCGVNPSGSLRDISGAAILGRTTTIALHDPTGALAAPATSVVAISAAPLPTFPCGVAIGGLGLGPPGAPGELLVAPPFPVTPGPAWNGTPALYRLPIPFILSLLRTRIYVQGVLVDATRVGLTDAIVLGIGS